MPGEIALTRMPRGARWMANDRVTPWMAVFVAPYTAVSRVYAQRADGDEKLTMAPPSAMAAPMSRHRNQTASTLTEKWRQNTSWVTSATGMTWRMAAALTRKCGGSWRADSTSVAR